MDIADIVIQNVWRGDQTSPFLFVWNNLEWVNAHAEALAYWLCEQYDIPHVAFAHMMDDGNALKITDVKGFFKKAELSSPYKIQIFLLENISRMTLSSSNSCLKLFEEPWVQNIIFLTNTSESQILDTILSRVQVIPVEWVSRKQKSDFYFGLIDTYLHNKNPEIFAYFFKNKLEKSEYIDFLENMILYARTHWVFIDLLEEINQDIMLIQTNNVNAKGVVDSYLLRI